MLNYRMVIFFMFRVNVGMSETLMTSPSKSQLHFGSVGTAKVGYPAGEMPFCSPENQNHKP